VAYVDARISDTVLANRAPLSANGPNSGESSCDHRPNWRPGVGNDGGALASDGPSYALEIFSNKLCLRLSDTDDGPHERLAYSCDDPRQVCQRWSL